MKKLHKYTAVFGLILLFANNSAMSESNDSQWDFYLQSIDPYANETDKPSSAISKSEKEKERPSRTINKPKPLPNGATPQQISEYNRKMQKALREQQKLEADNLYETVESMGYKPAHKPSLPEKPFTIASSSSMGKSGYSAKKVNFNWGGEVSGYEYADYEFVLESTNPEHTNQLTIAMTKMAKAGWEVDLNRSFQRIDGNGENVRAFTTTQMRFRRTK